MDLEHLTKHQIVLLTLLVSFVTSIGTGIVTVALMNQAPPEVQRTINQIVEHTVEKVVQAPAVVGLPTPAAVVTTIKTVVVKDDDLAAQSIATVQKSIIRIVSKNDPDTLVTRGIIIDSKGVALADLGSLAPLGTATFEAILPSGERVPAIMRIPSATSSVAVLDLKVGTTSVAARLADPKKLQLGQSVIRIGGGGADTVGTGVIAALPSARGTIVQTSISSITPGSVIITIFGEIIGIVTTASASVGSEFYSLATSP